VRPLSKDVAKRLADGDGVSALVTESLGERLAVMGVVVSAVGRCRTATVVLRRYREAPRSRAPIVSSSTCNEPCMTDTS
jgi:L-asparaginase/Glu-tRNA(Gln) amidotransferase subunit D